MYPRSIVLAATLALFFVQPVSSYSVLFPNEQWETGDIPLDRDSSTTLYYYLFKSRSPAPRSLVIWLNGGPGSSSAVGLLLENGPYMLNKTGGLNRNPYAWNEFHDVLFVDQPAGVGYSKLRSPSRACRNGTCVAKEFYAFLLGFYSLHPEYAGRPLYMTGESYAGHFLPAIAGYLIRANNPDIQIKGIAIGNGFTDSIVHFSYAPEFLYRNGLLNLGTYILASAAALSCNMMTVLGSHPKQKEHDYCTVVDFAISKLLSTVINVYNIDKNYTYDDNLRSVENFFADKTVQKAFNTEGRNFTRSSEVVADAMELDATLSLSSELGFVADSGCNVLLFYGNRDYVCNWMGGEALAHLVPWSWKDDFAALPYQDWTVNGKRKGQLKKLRNYALLVVENAGHLLPLDLPMEAREVLEQFIAGAL